MARRTPPADAAGTNLEAINPETPAPAMPGGTPGILPGASTKVHFAGTPDHVAATVDPPEPVPAPKQFEVFDCPKPPNGPYGYRFVLGGLISWLPDGKIVDSTTYDIDMLRRQGVKLRPVKAA